ncbi:helix-turn-helix transcriptional regulator [Leptothoe sp. PORK10 BA2]|uniref:helix-turn-helix transcriptional regulator n=1 Tax=Leptothoe sp. PORK10 BA2 TaxID=3110254 RepID=UPI002B211986|nr:LuxR C-terminal-related transcriptional regulator [Leptothoe sp. PORK10 BA2]MEA5464418.1 LuxR C-terminal-related transcriptional regulator [Leptothoe sp. PORK10 BA2]
MIIQPSSMSPAPVKRAPHPFSPLPQIFSPSPDEIETAILANWIDGILVLTQEGRLLHSNDAARRMCDRIAQNQPCIHQVPQEIWETCQILIQSRSNVALPPVTAESELWLQSSQDQFRIRARWFTVNNRVDPYILVILENQKRSWQNLAITEAIRYDLSPREADVWIFHRLGLRYQEIAAKLHIAINTVKKHMKNAYAKRELVSFGENDYTDKLAS